MVHPLPKSMALLRLSTVRRPHPKVMVLLHQGHISSLLQVNMVRRRQVSMELRRHKVNMEPPHLKANTQLHHPRAMELLLRLDNMEPLHRKASMAHRRLDSTELQCKEEEEEVRQPSHLLDMVPCRPLK